MPLPVKNALNNAFLPNASNEWDIFTWPNGLINNLITYHQLPFNLLIHHIPCHRPFIFLQPHRNPFRQLTLSNCQPISHRSHKANQLILDRDFPEVFSHEPVIFFNEEALTRCNSDWHTRSTELPRIIRYEGFNKLPRHKAKNK